MDNLVPIGRIFFALALIGLGIEHFVFQDFVTGRAPVWPEVIPGRPVWAGITGVIFIATAVAILVRRHARFAAILAALLVFVWALLRHLPVVAGSTLLSGAWTSAGKALVFTGGFLAIAATFPRVAPGRRSPATTFVNAEHEFFRLGRGCLAVFLVITGIQHFMFPVFVASLIPAWFPGNATFWTYAAGVALITGGVGLLVPVTARAAALLSGVMVFSWFWIVHVPRTTMGVSDGIAVFEALAFSGILFVLAGVTGARSTARAPA